MPVAVLSPVLPARSWIWVLRSQIVAVHAAWHSLLEAPLERVVVLRGQQTLSRKVCKAFTPGQPSVKHARVKLAVCVSLAGYG